MPKRITLKKPTELPEYVSDKTTEKPKKMKLLTKKPKAHKDDKEAEAKAIFC